MDKWMDILYRLIDAEANIDKKTNRCYIHTGCKEGFSKRSSTRVGHPWPLNSLKGWEKCLAIQIYIDILRITKQLSPSLNPCWSIWISILPMEELLVSYLKGWNSLVQRSSPALSARQVASPKRVHSPVQVLDFPGRLQPLDVRFAMIDSNLSLRQMQSIWKCGHLGFDLCTSVRCCPRASQLQ